MTDLDIDIWGRGRDAAAAGRFMLEALMAGYPFVEVPATLPAEKLSDIMWDHFNDLNHFGQREFKCWPPYQLTPTHIFFQSREDAELCQALFYIY